MGGEVGEEETRRYRKLVREGQSSKRGASGLKSWETLGEERFDNNGTKI